MVMLTTASFSALLLSTLGKLRSMNCAGAQRTTFRVWCAGVCRPGGRRVRGRGPPHRQRDSYVAGVVAKQQAADASAQDERVNLRRRGHVGFSPRAPGAAAAARTFGHGLVSALATRLVRRSAP